MNYKTSWWKKTYPGTTQVTSRATLAFCPPGTMHEVGKIDFGSVAANEKEGAGSEQRWAMNGGNPEDQFAVLP